MLQDLFLAIAEVDERKNSMLKIRSLSTCVTGGIVLLSVAAGLFPLSAAAQGRNAKYIVLLASGFLCDPGDSSACPVVAKSSQGDAYEINGAGVFDADNKSVNAAGTYTHRSPNGSSLETGVWFASELVSFNSYGAAPTALQRQHLALGPQFPGLRRVPIPMSPMPTGGLAVLRIHLLPLRGSSRSAVLQVNCALGDVPRERSVEGIRLSFEANARDFSEESGGRIMFLSMRLAASAPAKTSERQTAQEAQPPHN